MGVLVATRALATVFAEFNQPRAGSKRALKNRPHQEHHSAGEGVLGSAAHSSLRSYWARHSNRPRAVGPSCRRAGHGCHGHSSACRRRKSVHPQAPLHVDLHSAGVNLVAARRGGDDTTACNLEKKARSASGVCPARIGDDSGVCPRISASLTAPQPMWSQSI
jgi:hypothetical protein